MDWKTDETLLTLIKRGKESGSLTFDEVNQALPELSEPERLAELQELLEQYGISLIDEADTEDREENPQAVTEELLAEAELPSFED
ncbi:MAG TPA: RNA polymerase sigma factor region1.1 domain-containing protein, partial [Urbifossiella sp.]|nr:RNA polymerase sigma factor region1.1 domain-containing protein [Urbifossiella sp.]